MPTMHVWVVLLYASEAWAATQEDVSCLNLNDMMMIRWVCSAKLKAKYHRKSQEVDWV